MQRGNNVLRWSISKTGCDTDFKDITVVNNLPSTAIAGSDKAYCGTSNTITAVSATHGTGLWTKIAGNATIVSSTKNNSLVTNLSAGVNTFRWTVSTAACPSNASTDDMIITYDYPETADAGDGETLCSATFKLTGVAPAIGTGTWSIVSGSATFVDKNLGGTSVTVGSGVNVLRWEVVAGCPRTDNYEDVSIKDNRPTTATVGLPEVVCNPFINSMSGNIPSVGIGRWTDLTTGKTAVIVNSTLGTTKITNLKPGANTFKWTISSSGCTDSEVQIVVTNGQPAVVNAGSAQTVCRSTATLAADAPDIGTGAWSDLTGGSTPATFSDVNSRSSSVGNLKSGINTLRWTVSSPNGCGTYPSDVLITYRIPTATAGIDQTLCGTAGTLNGNTLLVGTGKWTVISGTATFANSANPKTTVGALGEGANKLRWTVTTTCATPFDEVVINNNKPTVSNPSTVAPVCATTATLKGNIVTNGTGTLGAVIYCAGQ